MLSIFEYVTNAVIIPLTTIVSFVISVFSNLPGKLKLKVVASVLVRYPDIFEVLISILTCAVFAWAWIWMNLRVSFVEKGGGNRSSKQKRKKSEYRFDRVIQLIG